MVILRFARQSALPRNDIGSSGPVRTRPNSSWLQPPRTRLVAPLQRQSAHQPLNKYVNRASRIQRWARVAMLAPIGLRWGRLNPAASERLHAVATHGACPDAARGCGLDRGVVTLPPIQPSPTVPPISPEPGPLPEPTPTPGPPTPMPEPPPHPGPTPGPGPLPPEPSPEPAPTPEPEHEPPLPPEPGTDRPLPD